MDAAELARENAALRTQLAEQAAVLKDTSAKIKQAMALTKAGSDLAREARQLGETAIQMAGGSVSTSSAAPAPEPEMSASAAAVYSLDQSQPLSVIVFGATGDLARKKLFPALYQLVLLGHFPRHVNIVGYGRKPVVMEDFLEKQCANVKENPSYPKADFLASISFHAGGYDDASSYVELNKELGAYEHKLMAKPGGNRLFFLSIPPTIFGTVCSEVSTSARSADGFTHLIIEKPFGRDSATFDELNSCTSSLFDESQLFRIDHYLGKEIVLNIATLRFSNQMFEPIWNNKYIESVEVTFKEDLGTGGRGGYFDKFGIIRDIMQNHLLQVFMFLAIEPPASMSGPDICKAKVDLLKATRELSLDDNGVFLGQFAANTWNVSGKEHAESGYLEDETVPAGSGCPTFAAVVLRVDNARWKGVPFLMKAGKGLDERMAEVRIKFKPRPCNVLLGGAQGANELVMRIQPNEAVYMKTVSKLPGLAQVTAATVMDMTYATQFPGAYVGDAYERMFLNAAKGDGSLFVSSAELVEAWRLFTPLLHQIDEMKPAVTQYPFGTRNPAGFVEWSKAQAGVDQSNNWQEFLAAHASDTERLKAVFGKMDADGSGAVDAARVRAFARAFYDGREPTAKKVDEVVARLDVGGDGTFNLGDLLAGAEAMRTSFGEPHGVTDPEGW